MMKTFKFGLVGLLIGLFGLVNFSNAGSFTYTGHFEGTRSNLSTLFALPTPLNGIPYSGTAYVDCSFSNYNSNLAGIGLIGRTYGTNINSHGNGTVDVKTSFTIPDINSVSFEFIGNSNYLTNLYGGLRFVAGGGFSENVSFDWSCTIYGSAVLDIPICQDCPEVDTGAILSGYVSESLLNECITDKNSCQSSISGYNTSLSNCSNSLNTCNTNLNSCLQSNCGDIQWSALYINNIQHLSSPVINIDIPEEISWDYTGDENSFDLNVEGYNVDTEYIEGIINTQNSKPNNQDFNNIIVGVLPLLIPGFIIIMFIYFIFRLIKKIF